MHGTGLDGGQRRVGRDGAADVAGFNQGVGAQRRAIAQQHVHRAGGGPAITAIAHGFFFASQSHGFLLRWGTVGMQSNTVGHGSLAADIAGHRPHQGQQLRGDLLVQQIF